MAAPPASTKTSLQQRLSDHARTHRPQLTRVITVFGASGPVGRAVVAQALSAGHAVTAVTRRPDAFGPSAPLLRVVSAAAQVGPYRQSESTLTRALLGSLSPGMLVLADRGFFSYALWRAAIGRERTCCGG